MALSGDRILKSRLTAERPIYGYPVQAGFKVWRGSIVEICSDGTIVPAGAPGPNPAAVKVVGLASHQQDNTTAQVPSPFSGTAPVEVYRGIFALPFDTAPTAASVGLAVYAVDDQTVSLSSSSATRLQVGTLDGFDADGTPYVSI